MTAPVKYFGDTSSPVNACLFRPCTYMPSASHPSSVDIRDPEMEMSQMLSSGHWKERQQASVRLASHVQSGSGWAGLTDELMLGLIAMEPVCLHLRTPRQASRTSVCQLA
ncbi:hypothetical protein V8C26DRAFT_384566 [Trichoderma gracile]